MANITDLKVGHLIDYNHNGNIYTGKIMEIKNDNIVVIETDNEAGFTLWNAGYAVGTCIVPSQITYHATNQDIQQPKS